MATRTFHLIFGQSNARGAAQKVDLTDLRYDITQTDVRQYTRLDTVFGGTASAAMTIPSGSFSIEAAYGYHLRNDAGQLPLIFRDGWSGTSLAGSWQPEAAGGEWADALDAMWQCYEAAKTEFSGDDLVFGSLVWIQGEADVQNSTFAAAYEANLVKLGNAFRGELGANLPIVFVQLSENCGVTPGSPGDLAVVRAAYVSAAATLGNCAVVDATPIALQVDDVHYTADGLMELGDDVYAAYATLASGTQLARTGRAFDVVDSAHTFANSAQAAVGDRDENPTNGGFGRRLGNGCRDPWPTTPRDMPLAHPYQDVWYVPVDSVMVANGTLDVTTDARPIDLAWSNLIPAVVPVWSPSDLSSLTLWFDENGIPGSPITQWDDQAGVIGGGAYLYQANSSYKPGISTINGVTVASFNSDFMRTLKLPGAVTLPLSDAISASSYHVFAVASVQPLLSNVTSTIGYQLPGIITDVTGNWYPFNFRYIDASTIEVVGGHWVGSDVTVSAGNIAVNTPVLLEAWYDGTDFRIQVDGNTPGSASAGNVASLTSQINVGSNYTRSHLFKGLASDIIVCNAALSAGDRASARSYLADKYGITL
jgi:hypothetical protein